MTSEEEGVVKKQLTARYVGKIFSFTLSQASEAVRPDERSDETNSHVNHRRSKNSHLRVLP